MTNEPVLVQTIAAFAEGAGGGNPAGVSLGTSLPSERVMQAVAAQVGVSETAFVAPAAQGWKVRYFAPETEVPFCGHATIALTAALAASQDIAEFQLTLNHAQVAVRAEQRGSFIEASFASPATSSKAAPDDFVEELLDLFAYLPSALDPRLRPAVANAGANHLIVPLASRATLAAMKYDLDQGRLFMRTHDLVTVAFVYAESRALFHARNAFASGGVYEDPATGAAAAALAGYLRDMSWVRDGVIEVLQGEDMGMPSRIRAEFAAMPGSSVRIVGRTRPLTPPRAYSA
ncbi:MAG: PhzF family phenazine biosynthesis protein [Steroidobacteraceae bacterium]